MSQPLPNILAIIVITFVNGYSGKTFGPGYLESGRIFIHGEALLNHGRGYYSTPYDSTQGVPDYVFIGFWIIIIIFLIRLGWEYRDDIFKRKE